MTLRWYLHPSRALLLALPSLAGCLILAWPEPRDENGRSSDPDRESSITTESESGDPIGTIRLDPPDPTTVDDITIVAAPQQGQPEPNVVSVRWLLGGTEVEAYRGQTTLPSSATTRGDTWRARVTLSASDRESVAQEDITIVNARPVVTDLSLSPQDPTVEDEVRAHVTAFDDDDDDLTFRYEWQVGGEPLPDLETDTLPAGAFAKGQEIRLRVTPFDGRDWGEPVASDSLVALNSPPRILSVALDPTEPRIGETVTATVEAVDPDEDPVTLHYEWWVRGAIVQEGESPVLGAEHFDKGRVIFVRVTPSDDEEEGDTVRSDEVRWTNTPPTAPEIALIPEIPRDGQPLDCEVVTESFDPDDTDLEYRFSWTVDGAPYTGDTLHSSGMRSRVDGAEVDPFEEWQCAVVAFDGEEEGAEAMVEAGSKLSLRPRHSRIAAGEYVGHAIDDRGRIWSWGMGGKVGNGSTSDRLSPALITTVSLATFVSVSREYSTSIALDDDGQIWTWGMGSSLLARTGSDLAPHPVPSLSNIVDVQGRGGGIALALRDDGVTYAWGWNGNGMLGLGFKSSEVVPSPAETALENNIVSISVGGQHALALDDDGQVWAWGRRAHFALGDGLETGESGTPVLVPIPERVVEVHAGGGGSWAVDIHGEVWAWGWNQGGLVPEIGAPELIASPRLIDLPLGVAAAHLEARFGAFVSPHGSVYSWGAGSSGQLGHGLATTRTTPGLLTSLSNIEWLAAEPSMVMAMDRDGRLWAWGNGTLGRGIYEEQNRPTYIGRFGLSFVPAD